MILPTNEECVRVIKELADEPTLTEWQSNFIEGNAGRLYFTDKQKEVIWDLKQKFQV